MNEIRTNNAPPVAAVATQRPARPAVADQGPPGAVGRAVSAGQRPETKAAETPETKQVASQPSAQELQKMTEDLQRRVGAAGSQLEFSVDKESGESVVKILDRATKEVIRQIPSEEMLRIARGLERYQEGLLIDSQA